eukprot:CAMPEP_0198318110 /NCGR_PEP_ID=MMETSP1450-20131203/7483_1 /TAXON_ID=753684 ORGANISM="Madagascaria erythrocladiodes, Strain CCMP3234" /NCGR_SAMPLE_ID=MMETSP1450 /ASSEMBLY_ACC=CAM_ASM_001115 /LENGTH=154 /DNA_ID=CAMNT_0044021383 /DNA_START=84 /DNA_END=545 /DNA_ORIENTATION=-
MGALELGVEGLVKVLDRAAVGDHNVLDGLVARRRLGVFDFRYDVHTLKNHAKDNMLAVQPWRLCDSDEKLGSVGVLAAVRHAQKPRLRVLDLEVFVFKRRSIDRLAPSPIALIKITALDHKALDHSMKLRPLVAITLTPLRQSHKVLHRLGRRL